MWKSSRGGFTLVELSLSIAFIGILSITIALIINNAISTYRRGLTLNQINTVGMDLVDDMRTVIQNSPVSILNDCEGSDGVECLEKYILVVGRAGEVKRKNSGELVGEDVPVFGAFCTGSYSYIWNSGYFFADDMEVLSSDGEARLRGYNSRIGLLKVKDKERSVCHEVEGNEFTVGEKEVGEGSVTELLSASAGNGLALYDLFVPIPAINDKENAAFYSVSFILGTVQGGINVMSSGNFCATPDDYDSNFDYCAINKFNFAAQANGG